MKAFVTGATGFIGSALVAELLRRGDTVTALVRQSTGAEQMRRLGARPEFISIHDVRRLAQAMAGCDVVFHLAGRNQWGLPKHEADVMVSFNVGSALCVAEAAKLAGVPRFVFTSSAATIGEAKGTIGREGSSHRGWYLSAYEASKRSAEQALQRMTGIDVIVVNPSSVQGPGRVAGTGKIMLAIVNGTLPVFVDTHLSICHITDCVQGHILAAELGKPGERYILSGNVVTTSQVFAGLSLATGLPLQPRFIPHWLAMAGATVAERIAWWQGKAPSWSREKMRAILHGHRFDGGKATRELGLQYTPLPTALWQTVKWYHGNGFVRRSLPNFD